MAPAYDFEVPLYLVVNAINSFSEQDLDQSTVECGPDDSIARQLQGRLHCQIINMTVLYLTMVELHETRCQINGQSTDFSSFGIDRYANSSPERLRSDFGAISFNWPSAAHGQRRYDSGWLSKYIRNSFAHGATTIRWQDRYLGVSLANSMDRRASDFQLWMPVKSYVRLIAHSAKDHVDKCRICNAFIERPTDVSAKLKIFLQWLVGGRQSARGQMRLEESLRRPA